MKLLFISLHNPNSIGVNKKVLQQIEFFEKSNFDVKAILVSPYYERTELIGSIQYVKMEKQVSLSKFFSRRYIRKYQEYFFQNKYYKILFEYLENYVERENFEAIYFRHAFANYPLLHFVNKYKGKVIFEHNTKEISELELCLKEDSGLKYNILMEKLLAKKIFSRSLFGVAVTKEIENYENKRAGFNYCNFIYKNPIRTEDFTPRILVKNKKYTIAALIGSYDEWHGLDLLCDDIRLNNKESLFRFIYIGNRTKRVEEICEGIEINFVGKQEKEGILKYLGSADITMGTLAPYRSNVFELSSLKTREYIAMGVPFIIGCEDTAMNNLDPEIMQFVRIIQFNESINATNEIQKFINFIRESKDHSSKMNEFAKTNLDYKPVFRELEKHIKNAI